jgi:outer membrane protein
MMKRKKTITLLIATLLFGSAFSETLSLEACIELAMKNNAELRQSDYSLSQADLNVKNSRSDLMPNVSAGASAKSDGPLVDEYTSDWNWGVSAGVSQAIYKPGLFSRIKLSKIEKEMTRISSDDLKSRIRLDVQSAYYQILTSDSLIAVYKENIRLADEENRKMQLMVNLGMKRPSDLLKSEVQKGTFESQMIQEQQNLKSLMRDLNFLMGREPDAPLSLEAESLASQQVPEFEIAFSILLEKNPDLKKAAKQVAADKLSVCIAREAYLPSASASYSYNGSKNAISSKYVESDQVGVQLSLSLFEGFSRNQNLQSEKINLASSELEYTTLKREKEQTLRDYYTSLDTQVKLTEIYRKNLESAQKDFDVVSEQYASGMASILDLMDARVSLLESQTNLLKVQYSKRILEEQILYFIGM